MSTWIQLCLKPVSHMDAFLSREFFAQKQKVSWLMGTGLGLASESILRQSAPPEDLVATWQVPQEQPPGPWGASALQKP